MIKYIKSTVTSFLLYGHILHSIQVPSFSVRNCLMLEYSLWNRRCQIYSPWSLCIFTSAVIGGRYSHIIVADNTCNQVILELWALYIIVAKLYCVVYCRSQWTSSLRIVLHAILASPHIACSYKERSLNHINW